MSTLQSTYDVDCARILVIDDDRDNAESMACLLGLFGHDVHVALDGPRAIEVASRERPSHVLLDPGLDGYQVASRLRRELGGSAVLIAVTGYGREEDRRRALASGCDHHFVKPIDHDMLIGLIAAPDGRGMPAARVVRQVEVCNALGLHLRAADQFARLARRFAAEVRVGRDGEKVSARSILGLMTLAAARGSRLELEAEGLDAEAAVDALIALVARGFDGHDH